MRSILIILAIAFGLLLLLGVMFPHTPVSGEGRTQMFINLVLIVLFGSSLVVQFSGNLKGALGRMFIWVVIFLGLIVAYSFKPQFMDLKNRLAGQLFPTSVVMTASGEMVLTKSDDGHFYVDAKVNGAPLRFLVDTGASSIMIAPHDAERMGLAKENLRFNQVFQTANGMARGAGIRLHTLEIGTIRLVDMPASVNSAEMDYSLLGMRFLGQLRSYRVEGDKLILVP